jgi:hypothetical protein
MPESVSFQGRPVKPRSRRRLFVAVCLLLLIAIGGAIPMLLPRWREFHRHRWEQAEHARELSAVLNDAPPVGTVAFEEQSDKAAALSSLPNYAVFNHPLTERAGARRRLLELAKLDPRRDDIDGKPSVRQHAILFCHELQIPSGQKRLVVVEGVVNWESGSPGQTHLIPVATTFSIDAGGIAPLHPTSESEGPLIDGAMSETEPAWALRVFAGQLDPKDGSHFTIDYQTSSGGKGTIDGWLRQTSGKKGMTDEVEMKLR